MIGTLKKLFSHSAPPIAEPVKQVVVEKVVEKATTNLPVSEMTDDELQKHVEAMKAELLARKHKREKEQQAVCEHTFHEYKNRQGEIAWRECHKCWLKQQLVMSHWETRSHF